MLEVLENKSMAEIFTKEGSDDLLDVIKKGIKGYEHNISTDPGRKDIISKAYAMAKSKTFIESCGKDFIAEKKAEVKKVDDARKYLISEINIIQKEFRKPLTDWEDAKKAKKEADILQDKIEKDHDQALIENKAIDQEKIIKEQAELIAKADEERKAIKLREEIRLQKEKEIKEAVELEKMKAQLLKEQAIKEAIELEKEKIKLQQEKEDKKKTELEDKLIKKENVDKVHNHLKEELMECGYSELDAHDLIAMIEGGDITLLKINYGGL